MCSLEIWVRDINGVSILDIRGPFSFLGCSCAELEKIVDEKLKEGHKKIVLDLIKVTSIDRSSLEEISRLLKYVNENNGSLALLSSGGNKGIAGIVGMEIDIKAFNKEEEAVKWA
jgi:MFS superfamily sulfate permease-like transporter